MELFIRIIEIAFPVFVALHIINNIWQVRDLKWDIELERTIRQSQMEYLFEEIEKLTGKKNG
jgi:hypothetical protein